MPPGRKQPKQTAPISVQPSKMFGALLTSALWPFLAPYKQPVIWQIPA
jgi:hypothetical protein